MGSRAQDWVSQVSTSCGAYKRVTLNLHKYNFGASFLYQTKDYDIQKRKVSP